MRTALALLTLALTPTAILAASWQVPVPNGADLETRLDADLDGDGDLDTAYVIAGDETRELAVALAERGDRREAGRATLGVGPLGPASLKLVKGVLVVEDLTGGTTATQATYRYRWDAGLKEFRLIGLDATNYSRTFQHDGFEISWNLLTGTVQTTKMVLSTNPAGPEAYSRFIKRTLKRFSPPVPMDETPDPDELIEELSR